MNRISSINVISNIAGWIDCNEVCDDGLNMASVCKLWWIAYMRKNIDVLNRLSSYLPHSFIRTLCGSDYVYRSLNLSSKRQHLYHISIERLFLKVFVWLPRWGLSIDTREYKNAPQWCKNIVISHDIYQCMYLYKRKYGNVFYYERQYIQKCNRVVGSRYLKCINLHIFPFIYLTNINNFDASCAIIYPYLTDDDSWEKKQKFILCVKNPFEHSHIGEIKCMVPLQCDFHLKFTGN